MNAVYARQSLDKKDSLSIETQIELCKQESQDRDYLCGKNEVIGFPHPHMSNGLDVPIKKYFYEGSLRS